MDQQKLLELLDQSQKWPGPYTFKFVVLLQQKNTLLDLFPHAQLKGERPSKTGKYVSLTIEQSFEGPMQVVESYQKASQIPGIISL